MNVGVQTIVGWSMMVLGISLFIAFPNSKDTDGPTTRNNSPIKKLGKYLFIGGIILAATDPVSWAEVTKFKSR